MIYEIKVIILPLVIEEDKETNCNILRYIVYDDVPENN